jgi:hypothetical protein
MERSSIKHTMRWLLVPLAALVGFLSSIVLASPLNMLIHSILWTNGHAMPGKSFLLYAMPYDGALAASLFIQFGTYAAPSHKKLTALCLLVCGGFLAWYSVGEFYSPQTLIHHGPIRVWWPIIGTYVGGLLTLAWIWLAARTDRVTHIS